MKSSTALLSLLFLLQKSWTVVAFQSLAPPRRLPRPQSSSFATRIQRPHVAELSVSIHNEVDPVIRKRRLATWMALFTGMADVALSLRKLRSMIFCCFFLSLFILIFVCRIEFQTFATMLTGNLMWLSRALVERNVPTVLYYISVVSFVT